MLFGNTRNNSRLAFVCYFLVITESKKTQPPGDQAWLKRAPEHWYPLITFLPEQLQPDPPDGTFTKFKRFILDDHLGKSPLERFGNF